jgi:hypothetical protein
MNLVFCLLYGHHKIFFDVQSRLLLYDAVRQGRLYGLFLATAQKQRRHEKLII